MRMLRLSLEKPLDWDEIYRDPETYSSPVEIELSDGQRIEVTEVAGGDGLQYLSLRTREGSIAIYPEVANGIRFRIISD